MYDKINTNKSYVWRDLDLFMVYSSVGVGGRAGGCRTQIAAPRRASMYGRVDTGYRIFEKWLCLWTYELARWNQASVRGHRVKLQNSHSGLCFGWALVGVGWILMTLQPRGYSWLQTLSSVFIHIGEPASSEWAVQEIRGSSTSGRDGKKCRPLRLTKE